LSASAGLSCYSRDAMLARVIGMNSTSVAFLSETHEHSSHEPDDFKLHSVYRQQLFVVATCRSLECRVSAKLITVSEANVLFVG